MEEVTLDGVLGDRKEPAVQRREDACSEQRTVRQRSRDGEGRRPGPPGSRAHAPSDAMDPSQGFPRNTGVSFKLLHALDWSTELELGLFPPHSPHLEKWNFKEKASNGVCTISSSERLSSLPASLGAQRCCPRAPPPVPALPCAWDQRVGGLRGLREAPGATLCT